MNVKELRTKYGLSQSELAEKTGIPKGRINGWEQQGSKPKSEDTAVLEAFFEELAKKHSQAGGRVLARIPLYDAIAVAGLTTIAADQSPVYEAAEYIDAGTWFRSATAAMRIAGDSMFPKYRPGCFVALREVFDKEDIDYGKDYVIETTENRWLKRLMKSEQGVGYIELTSYSTLTDQRGKLVHAPRDLHVDKIKRIYRVLGQVLHESGGEDILHRHPDPKMAINLKEK